MRKTAFILLIALCVPAWARAAAPKVPPLQTVDKLKVNRKLLSQYSSELGRLRRAERHIYTESVHERMADLLVKIRALKEDAQRLKSRLPMTAQADMFLQNFIQRHGDLKRPAPPAKAQPVSETMRLHEEALRLVADRKFTEAAQRYEEIILNNPDDDEAYLLMGHVYLMLGEYSRAEFAYYNAVHIDKDNYDDIVPFYQNMVVQNPDDDEAFRYLGYAYVILGDAIRAKDSFREALRINPSNSEAAKGLALLKRQFGI